MVTQFVTFSHGACLRHSVIHSFWDSIEDFTLAEILWYLLGFVKLFMNLSSVNI